MKKLARFSVKKKKQESIQFRPHLFWREMEEVVAALKTKSCLSVSEFFLFSGNNRGNSQKSAAGEFSFCFRFSFVRAKEK